MQRDHYTLFSEAKIGTLTVPNRLVRSATRDPSILIKRDPARVKAAQQWLATWVKRNVV